MLIPSLLSVKLAKWRKSLLNVLGSMYEIWVLSSSKDCFYTVLSHFCALNRHTHIYIYTYICISFLFVPFFINCWFFCPLLRFERWRRTSPGIRTSGFGADGGSRRYEARQDIQMLWTVKVWEGSTGCEKHPPLVVEVKKRYFNFHHTTIHIPHE